MFRLHLQVLLNMVMAEWLSHVSVLSSQEASVVKLNFRAGFLCLWSKGEWTVGDQGKQPGKNHIAMFSPGLNNYRAVIV